ncbi:unnamed protein product [Cyprideis torosa]|uniref:Uncharacterized protein n=1 Tax=Cyprideis torosa TaxID=163714 RepID=A0A7R8WFG2_9CRUS|nr:unnamed protein product [Cyprideis torosa]CAG0890566.1 unnamed protein product [Cyprideis torosa]
MDEIDVTFSAMRKAFSVSIQDIVFIRTFTGDRLGAGTNAKVWIRLISEENETEDILLDSFWDDHERGKVSEFKTRLPPGFGDIKFIQLSRDSHWFASAWFLDKIEVESKMNAKILTFPAHRWIHEKKKRIYRFAPNDVWLPQRDPNRRERKAELEEKRLQYGMDFYEYYFSQGMDFYEYYFSQGMDFYEYYFSQGMDFYEDDAYFGRMRLQGPDPGIIQLCREIPENFAVTDDLLAPHLEGLTISEAIEKKRLFIIDLEILQGIYRRPEAQLCAPLALFFRRESGYIYPVAIQLNQNPGPDNPVFTPSDPPYTWLAAKVFYSNSEAMHHQSCAHLGFTHLLMEGVCVITHRNLSISHPMFKLLAPHFLFLLAINARGLKKLIGPGTWVDKTMTIATTGMFQLIAKGIERWSMKKQGVFPNHMKERGVLEKEVLPFYYYRDDGIELYRIIERYVSSMVYLYYETKEDVQKDYEIQEWRKEMTAPKVDGGCGLVDVPGDDEKGFTNQEELIETITVIIFSCSAMHGSANFCQYDAYGFPLNYPGMLLGEPPKNKKPLTERDILNYVSSQKVVLNSMVITKLLSMKGTNSLGDFEMQYIYDPPAVEIVEKTLQEEAMSQAEQKQPIRSPLPPPT